MPLPFEDAYWVEPGKLMAGPYPSEYDPHTSERRIRSLLACGVRTFINLMEAREERYDGGDAPAYTRVVERCAERLGVETTWLRFEIHDMSVPTHSGMHEIQAAIDAATDSGDAAYVHCWRGRGRTGTVIAAYLIRRGLATSDDFAEVLGRLRNCDPAVLPSPETEAQVEFVRVWARSLASG